MGVTTDAMSTCGSDEEPFPDGHSVLVVADSVGDRHRLRLDVLGLGFAPVDGVGLGALLVSRSAIDAGVVILHLADLDIAHAVSAVRRRTTAPIVTVARADGETVAAALDAGAGEHLELPFRRHEAAARLRAVMRREGDRERDRVVTTDFLLDFGARFAARDGAEIRLTPREWSLADVLVRSGGRIVRHHQLLAGAWGSEQVDLQCVRVCLHTLRRKLEPDPHVPRYFITVPRVGVRFDVHGGRPTAVADLPAGAEV